MDTEDRPSRDGRRLLLVVAWVATAALAIAVSGWAVGLASRQVTDPIAPTALTEVTRSVAPSPSVVPSPSPSPAEVLASPPAASGGPATAGPGGPDPTGSAGGAPSVVTTRTVSAVGGRASFRFAGDRVTLEWATPSPGFEVDVEGGGSDLRVRFRADEHESRIFASARGGQPSTRVEERADDSGGGDDRSDDTDDRDDADDA